MQRTAMDGLTWESQITASVNIHYLGLQAERGFEGSRGGDSSLMWFPRAAFSQDVVRSGTDPTSKLARATGANVRVARHPPGTSNPGNLVARSVR
jgi:hypothetical protein